METKNPDEVWQSTDECVYDGKRFTIDYLASSDSGFEVETEDTLLRHPIGEPMLELQRIKISRDKEPLKFKASKIFPLKGESLEDAKNRLLQRTRLNGKLELRDEDIIIEDDHLRILPGFLPLVGFRNLRLFDNVLKMDILPVTFSTYSEINSPNENKDSLNMANPTGLACSVMTTEQDGSNRFILQHRSLNNSLYKDILGASVAGYLNGELDKENRGKLMKINTESIRGHIIKEAEEELGLSEEDIGKVKIVGYAKDKIKIHGEILMQASMGISTREVSERVEKRFKENRSNDQFDFEGNFISIGASSDIIEKLLTEMKCPMAPTHTAMLLASGYFLVMKYQGLEAALEWKEKIGNKMEKNYDDIDKIVSSYWENNLKTGKKVENQKISLSYDPSLTPTDQGLPALDDELKRLNIKSQI